MTASETPSTVPNDAQDDESDDDFSNVFKYEYNYSAAQSKTWRGRSNSENDESIFMSTLSHVGKDTPEMTKQTSHAVRPEGDFDEKQEKYVNRETTVIEEPDESASDEEPERVMKYKRRTNSLPRQSQTYLTTGCSDEEDKEEDEEGEESSAAKLSSIPLLDSKDLKKLTKDKRHVPWVMMMNEEIKENLSSPYNEDFFKLVEGYMWDAISKYATNEEISSPYWGKAY